MNEEDREKIISNDYADLLLRYGIDLEKLVALEDYPINIINDKYTVIYFPASMIPLRVELGIKYSMIPKLFGLVDSSSLVEMGVVKVQSTPNLSLKGQGVLLGFVDTGIEYTNSLFKNADNTTRIVSIWDQTIDNMQASEDIFYYGTEYNKDIINLALQNEEPLSVVPSTDEIGHGTTLAGLAGGSRIEESDFVGVTPLAEYVVVKLKPAKANFNLYSPVPENTICFQENDIMFGIQYLINIANKLQKPIAICIGLGTNQGSHDGRDSLSDMISLLSNEVGNAIVVAAGNEGNRGHHYFGEIDKTLGYDLVDLKIGENESSFTMELWGNIPGIYSIDILSPSGEYIPRIPARINEFRVIKFLFEYTTVLVDYSLVESQSGDELILIRFQNPTPGIWRFKVYGGRITSGFHIWLPMQGFIGEDTVFLQPNPDTIVTIPGDASSALTVTAYDHKNQSIYRNASRGYSRTNIIKPEIAAPGVDVYSPLLGNQFGGQTGSSIATAQTTGVAAMILEWGIVKGNNRSVDTMQVKKYLIRGVNRNINIIYPNKEWGFGTLNIYGTFESLQGET